MKIIIEEFLYPEEVFSPTRNPDNPKKIAKDSLGRLWKFDGSNLNEVTARISIRNYDPRLTRVIRRRADKALKEKGCRCGGSTGEVPQPNNLVGLETAHQIEHLVCTALVRTPYERVFGKTFFDFIHPKDEALIVIGHGQIPESELRKIVGRYCGYANKLMKRAQRGLR